MGRVMFTAHVPMLVRVAARHVTCSTWGFVGTRFPLDRTKSERENVRAAVEAYAAQRGLSDATWIFGETGERAYVAIAARWDE